MGLAMSEDGTMDTEKYLFVGSPLDHQYAHLRLPFIVTKFETGGAAHCEVHAMTPEGEAWLMGRYEDVAYLYRQIVREVYGVDPLAGNWGGRIKVPSGSTWDQSLAWLCPTEAYAISLGRTEHTA